jgi:hypothetical protein
MVMKRFQKYLVVSAFLLAISGAFASKIHRPFNSYFGVDTQNNCVTGTTSFTCLTTPGTRCNVTIPVTPGSPVTESVPGFESGCVNAVYHQ